jgi:hypothetical protein
VATHGVLNALWGMAHKPASFGRFADARSSAIPAMAASAVTISGPAGSSGSS